MTKHMMLLLVVVLNRNAGSMSQQVDRDAVSLFLAPINSVQSQMSPVESLQNSCNTIIAWMNAYGYQTTEKCYVFLSQEYFCVFNFLKCRENGSRIASMNAIKEVEEGKVLIHRD